MAGLLGQPLEYYYYYSNGLATDTWYMFMYMYNTQPLTVSDRCIAMHIDIDLITYNPYLHDCTCTCFAQVVQPLSLHSSLYLVLYVDVSTLSQEDLSYLCMSFMSCPHQSCVATLTREEGDEWYGVSRWPHGTALNTQAVQSNEGNAPLHIPHKTTQH